MRWSRTWPPFGEIENVLVVLPEEARLPQRSDGHAVRVHLLDCRRYRHHQLAYEVVLFLVEFQFNDYICSQFDACFGLFLRSLLCEIALPTRFGTNRNFLYRFIMIN